MIKYLHMSWVSNKSDIYYKKKDVDTTEIIGDGNSMQS